MNAFDDGNLLWCNVKEMCPPHRQTSSWMHLHASTFYPDYINYNNKGPTGSISCRSKVTTLPCCATSTTFQQRPTEFSAAHWGQFVVDLL